MHPFDKQFSRNKLRYLLQCMLATISAMLVLMVLNTMTNEVVIASLGGQLLHRLLHTSSSCLWSQVLNWRLHRGYCRRYSLLLAGQDALAGISELSA